MAVNVATGARSLAVGGGKVGYGVDGFLLIELSCVFFLQEIGGV